MSRNENAQQTGEKTENGIFSTPDLTVNAENLAQEDSKATKNRVASFFANTDATQQAQKLNNAVMIPEQAQPAPDGFAVNNGTKWRSKLPVILIAIVVLAIAGVTVFFVMNNGDEGGKSSQISATLDEAKQNFRQYASYLLFGDRNHDLSGGYSPIQTYKFTEEFNSEVENSSYWSETTNLLDKVVDTYASIEVKSDYLQNLLESQRSLYTFLKDYHMRGDPTEAQLISSYSSGPESVRNYVENFYSSLIESDLYAVQTLAQQKIAYYNQYIDFIELNDAAGCVANGEIIRPCSNDNESEFDVQRYTDLLGEMNVASNLATGTLLDMVEDLEKQCWDIWDEFISLSESGPESEAAL